MVTTEELQIGDHVLMPDPITNKIDIWLVMNTFSYTRRVMQNGNQIELSMISLDLLGNRHITVHALYDQQWQEMTYVEFEWYEEKAA